VVKSRIEVLALMLRSNAEKIPTTQTVLFREKAIRSKEVEMDLIGD
jgi:hypothetical protein